MSASYAGRDQIRMEVKILYDLQRLRLQSGGRLAKRASEIHLSEEDLARLSILSDGIRTLEDRQSKDLEKKMRGVPIWEHYLKNVRGCGFTMAAVIYSEVDIEVATTVSKLWRYAGMAVIDGKPERHQRGIKSAFNSFLRSKLLKVLGDSLIKTNVRRCINHKPVDQIVKELRKAIHGTKSRPTPKPALGAAKTLLAEATDETLHLLCSALHDGAPFPEEMTQEELMNAIVGAAADKDRKVKVAEKEEPSTGWDCPSCVFGGYSREYANRRLRFEHQAWGKNDAHRHQAAVRFMVKTFLIHLWIAYRMIEGLPTREFPTYEEQDRGELHVPMSFVVENLDHVRRLVA